MLDNNKNSGTLDFGEPETPNTKTMLDFGEPDKAPSIIKVIGVGGGGGNAVNHMYAEGIHDVSFVVCNTDKQALDDSPVPVHLQLGEEGLGAGNRPAKAREAAEQSLQSIKNMLNDGTRMAFVTAGMGGGTGTGAAPVVARVSKEMDILTVGIVTIPFHFEGEKKIDQALDGVEEMSKHVDALLVINNERLLEIYPDMTVRNAFKKADDTLSVAAKSIAEIITVHGLINLDFNDVKTVLKDGGVAIMSTGYGEGEGRLKKAIDDALNSPLLNNNDIFNSKRVLLSINFNSDQEDNADLTMEEMNEVNDFMSRFSGNYELKWGLALDKDLDKKVKVTILATGFGISDVDMMQSHLKKTTIEEVNRLAAEAEEQERKRARRDKYYQNDQKDIVRHRPQIYLFHADDLDNEDVILAVENTPTYKRTKQQLASICKQASGDDTTEKKEEEAASIKGVISFA